MNLGPIIVLLKLLQDSGTVSPPPATPPTADVGVRPPDSVCGEGMKIVFKENPDRWVCVPKFK